MQALVVVDGQNEFAAGGQRAVPNAAEALAAIRRRVAQARSEGRPIVWVRHHNTPEENAASGAPAFVPETWGADYMPGLGPQPDRAEEVEFFKEVYGCFTGTPIGAWLDARGCDDIMLVGFYAHMCVSTTTREALMRGLRVSIDPDATGSVPLSDPLLGTLTADEARRSALLHLRHMGAEITPQVAEPQSAG